MHVLNEQKNMLRVGKK